MSKQLERALAAEKRAAEKRAGLERHEKLVQLARDFRAFVAAKNYGDAHAAAIDAVSVLEEMPEKQMEGGSEPQKES